MINKEEIAETLSLISTVGSWEITDVVEYHDGEKIAKKDCVKSTLLIITTESCGDEPGCAVVELSSELWIDENDEITMGIYNGGETISEKKLPFVDTLSLASIVDTVWTTFVDTTKAIYRETGLI